MDTLTPCIESPSTADVRALLTLHFDLMRAQSPVESCHVLAPDGLHEAGMILLGIRQGGTLLGIGALSRIGPQEGELKSMHTAFEARGQGIARRLLQALLSRAATDGMTRVSLETGSAAAFEPARALYTAEGFAVCSPFGSYRADPLSIFMSRKV